MTTFNKNLRMFEARILLTIRKYSRLTRANALLTLRGRTGGRGLDTVFCYNQLVTSPNQEKTINQLFGI